MIKEITRDIEVLQKKSVRIDGNFDQIVTDLIDTANANKERCIGLSAVQICEHVRIFVAFDGERFIPFVNPVIMDTSKAKYETEEGCMSLDGVRKTTRFNTVTVLYETKKGHFVKKMYGGRFAQIIQHEMDHLNGILI